MLTSSAKTAFLIEGLRFVGFLNGEGASETTRCICLGRAALRGSRMRGMGRRGKGSESRIARSSLSIARSSVCALSVTVFAY